MKRLVYVLFCLTPLVSFAGCGGAAEEKPPEKGKEMSAEEKKHMEDEVKKMQEMRKKQRIR